jgi:ferric-dicitrate binding protein FerR (iron transport regulator)
MHFEKYKLLDFLMDESFQNWVKQSDSDDSKFWESWLIDHPDKKEDAEEAKAMLNSVHFKDKGFSKQEMSDLWDDIRMKSIGSDDWSVYGSKIGIWKYLKVAAVLLPFIVAAVLFVFYRTAPVEEIADHAPDIIQKVNPKGQKLTTFLSDGSKVILNADSKITFSKPLGEKERVVTLQGEAFFDITPDANRPFIVKSGSMETTVLGTSFNVKAYPEENQITVAVKSGRVSVENKGERLRKEDIKSFVLSPDQMVTYTKSDQQTVVSEFDMQEIFGWSEGILYFNNASIEEFVKKVERWYGVDVILERTRPIAKGITGVYKDETLEEILMGHKEASEFDYTFLTNGKVVIK